MTNNCGRVNEMSRNGRDAHARYTSARSYSENHASELARQAYNLDPYTRGRDSPSRRPRFSHHLSLSEDKEGEEASTTERVTIADSLREESDTDDVTSARRHGLPEPAHAYASSSDSNTSMYDVTGLGPGSRFPWQRDIGVQCSLLTPPHESRVHSPGGDVFVPGRRLQLGVSIDSATFRSSSGRSQYPRPARSLSDSRNSPNTSLNLSGISGRLGARCYSDIRLQKKTPRGAKKGEDFVDLSSSLPSRHPTRHTRWVKL